MLRLELSVHAVNHRYDDGEVSRCGFAFVLFLKALQRIAGCGCIADRTADHAGDQSDHLGLFGLECFLCGRGFVAFDKENPLIPIT